MIHFDSFLCTIACSMIMNEALCYVCLMHRNELHNWSLLGNYVCCWVLFLSINHLAVLNCLFHYVNVKIFAVTKQA